ncbi:hypothetical protein [Curtobacterium sp. 260]|uniref:hypothetical protein n=1 Tax=Curtobacterium sp. 260 TaxID=2817748 RepID=UPI00278B2D17|nr:hypothetical protein [Curtobacterium sp. 260]MDP9736120.1 hypothetical protein [Curtobacterium sp. 260]
MKNERSSLWARVRAASKPVPHVHANLHDFAIRLDDYRNAARAERLEAVAVLTAQVAKGAHSGFTTMLGAGIAAVAAYVGVLGTYALFLQQSAVAVGRDTQARIDALTDAGKVEQASVGMKAMRAVGDVLQSGTDIVFTLGGVVLAAIVIGWLLIHDRAQAGAIAQAWLTAFERVDAEEAQSRIASHSQPRRKSWRSSREHGSRGSSS